MDFPVCSVVIPCGRQHCLPELLDALGKQTILPAQMEVIVVTPLKPSNRLEHSPPGIFWVETGQLLPPGRMRNLGAAVARGRILLFLDDDCIPPAEWVVHMQDNIDSKPGLGAVGCRVSCRDDSFWNRCADYVLFAAAQQVKSGPRFLMSAAMAVRRDSFDAVRGFDESLRASEDWDLCIRLAQAGWASHYDASLMVRHDHGRGGFRAIMGQCLESG